MSDSKRLTARQERFCHQYIKTEFNAALAAANAGYAKESAHVEGSRLLKLAKVKKRIDELSQATVKRANATADEVFEFATFAATFDPTVWVNVTATGLIVLKCDLDTLPPMVRKMVTKIKPTKFGIEVEWFSKEKALEMLARFHGMNKDQVTLHTDGDLTPEEMEELEAFRLKQDKTDAPPTP